MDFNKVAFGILMVLKDFDQISNIIAVLRVHIREWEIFMRDETIKVIKTCSENNVIISLSLI